MRGRLTWSELRSAAAATSDQAETSKCGAEQYKRGWLWHGRWTDLQRETVRVHAAAPGPDIGARSDAKASKGRAGIRRGVRQSTIGNVALRQRKEVEAVAGRHCDEVSATAAGAGKASAPETRRSREPSVTAQ